MQVFSGMVSKEFGGNMPMWHKKYEGAVLEQPLSLKKRGTCIAYCTG